MSPRIRAVINRAAQAGRVRVSAVSVWEVGMLDAKGRIRLAKDCLTWVTDALAAPGMALELLTPPIAADGTHLPGAFHGDPADRIIVATARILGATLVTKDARILEYGKADLVSVMPA